MGYFKNQIIADQVELGDRVPPPIPARRHLAYGPATTWPPLPARKDIRERQKRARKLLKKQMRADTWNLWGPLIFLALMGLSVGFLLGGVVFG